MAHGQSFVLPFGQAATVVTESGTVLTGTLLGLRQHNESSQRIPLLFIRLSAAAGPYVANEVVALNVTQIESIGPVTIA